MTTQSLRYATEDRARLARLLIIMDGGSVSTIEQIPETGLYEFDVYTVSR